MDGLPSVSESNYHRWHSSRSRRRFARSSALATLAAAAEKFVSAGAWVSAGEKRTSEPTRRPDCPIASTLSVRNRSSQLQDRLGDVGILAAEDPLIALADRDPAAEPAHRRRQLECNVAGRLPGSADAAARQDPRTVLAPPSLSITSMSCAGCVALRATQKNVLLRPRCCLFNARNLLTEGEYATLFANPDDRPWSLGEEQHRTGESPCSTLMSVL
jgi:hypothetical protein